MIIILEDKAITIITLLYKLYLVNCYFKKSIFANFSFHFIRLNNIRPNSLTKLFSRIKRFWN